MTIDQLTYVTSILIVVGTVGAIFSIALAIGSSIVVGLLDAASHAALIRVHTRVVRWLVVSACVNVCMLYVVMRLTNR